MSLLIVGLHAYSQTDGYREFDNIYPGSDASVVNCFIRDPQGLIWFGSDKGLYSYNGYSTQALLYAGENLKIQTNTKINCGIQIDPKHLCLGSDNGILLLCRRWFNFYFFGQKTLHLVQNGR